MIKTVDFTGIEVGREVVLSNGYRERVVYVDDTEFAVSRDCRFDLKTGKSKESPKQPDAIYLVEINPCPFCEPEEDDIVLKNFSAYARYDKYPVTPLHTLVIPFEHESCYFCTSRGERNDSWDLVEDVVDFLI